MKLDLLINRFLCKTIYIVFKNRNAKINEIYLKLKYRIIFNKKLDLKNPTTFNEKINWIKVKHYNPLYTVCSDKYEVRKYVESKGLKNILTKLYGVYSCSSEIDYDKLPNKFVLKATNSSGDVCIIRDKSKIDDDVSLKLERCKKNDLYRRHGEWQYKDIKPRIIAEELIENDGKELYDYKFLCFGGKVKLIYVASGINDSINYSIDFYDIKWKHLDICRVGHPQAGIIEKPKNLKEMIKVAEKLSKDFMQVRVDLYSTDIKIYFGELTFTTGAGYGTYLENADLEIGKYFHIYDDNKGSINV